MAFTKITSTNIAENTVAGYAEFANIANSLAPKITSIAITSNTYSVLDDTAVNVGGGFIVVTGTEFQSGVTVLIDTTPATAVSYVNNTTLRVQVPAKSAASYNLYVVNPDGGTGIKVAGITYSGTPTWVTASPLANVQSNTVFSNTFSATDAVSYANTTILPTGFNLLANGYYYGNISVGAATTYSFDIRATDAELQESDKTFSLTATAPLLYTVTYLSVAGGGGGGLAEPNVLGDGAGGGGAGGYVLSSALFNQSITYTITIGSGGTGANTIPAERGGSGSNTSITSPLGTIVTSIGGGGGGGGNEAFGPGNSGGSGGGAGSGYQQSYTGGSGFNFPGPTQQGRPGGNTTNAGNPERAGAGGGGAGNSGANSSPVSAGAGGVGLENFITGSSVGYAGGGGGGSGGGLARGSGSLGGGGAGANTSISAVNGTANLGGGGGGGSSRNSPGPGPINNGASGGSGVVILSMATANYPGSAPGATVTTSGANTILTFNSSGTYTA
jgi:hypothetical protein